jgi:hypothetical protein
MSVAFRYKESGDYVQGVEALQDLMEQPQPANNERHFEAVEVLQARAEVLESINRATGLEFNVVTDWGGASNVAAFIRTDSGEVYVREHILDDPTFALYAAQHEAAHAECENFDLNQVMGEVLVQSDWAVLADELSVTANTLENMDWVEALTDLQVADHAGHEHSGYADVVRVADRLDDLTRKHMGLSLKETFADENSLAVVNLLSELNRRLALIDSK